MEPIGIGGLLERSSSVIRGPEQCDRNTGALKDQLTIRILRATEELEQFRDYWNRWCADPTSDFENYLASARCRPSFIRPHVMVVLRNNQPDCLLVGWLEDRELKLRIGYTCIFEPVVRQLFFPQGGFIGNLSGANAAALAQELKRCLRKREADTVELPRLTPDSTLFMAAKATFGVLQRGHFTPFHEHRWAELPDSFSEFLKGLSRKNRHEIRRHERRLAEEFGDRIRVRCYRDEDEIDELADEVEKVSSKTYQRAIGAGFHQDAETVESLRSSARRRNLRGCVLYLDEQPRAFFIGKQCRDTFFGTFMGFDPQFGKYSPGLMILMHSIEECFDPNSRATRLDLGWGDRYYKRIFCNKRKQDGHTYLYPLSWSGLKLNLLRSSVSLIDVAARKLLEKSPFVQKVKRLWLSRVRESKSKSEFFEQECLE